MIQFHKLKNEQMIAEITQEANKIQTVDDVMDFIGDCYANYCVGVIIPQNMLSEDFFELKTGLAGEILQKFTNFHIKLAIVGDFANVESKSLRDFIRESNRRKFINFVESIDEARSVLE